ncbi:MAG: hypothetical protein ACYC7D_05310 [Nitrososphaerales archaeon]
MKSDLFRIGQRDVAAKWYSPLFFISIFERCIPVLVRYYYYMFEQVSPQENMPSSRREGFTP